MPTLPEILKGKIGKGFRSKAYVASKLGVSEKTVENYINGKRDPKPDRLVKLAEILDFKLSELSEQSVPQETIVKKAENHNGSLVPDKKEVYDRTIYHLAEGNRIQSETNQTVAETNQKLVDQNIALTQAFTGNADQRTFEETVATVLALREYLIELAASVMKVSPLEISQALNKKVKAAKEKGDNKGKPVGANM